MSSPFARGLSTLALASLFTVVSPLGAVVFAADLPANGWLAWASNRQQGRHEIYVQNVVNGQPLRVTTAGGQNPAWSPDGRWISYFNHADRTTHVVRADGTGDKTACNGFPVFWMHDNSGVVCAQLRTDNVGWEGMSRSEIYRLANPDLGTDVEFFKRSDFRHLADNFGSVGERHFMPGGITNDGRYMVGWVWGLFGLGYQADNGRFTAEHSSVAVDMHDRSKLFFLGPGCTTTTPSTGPLVYHVSREGSTYPDVFSLDTKDLATRASYKKVVGRTDLDWGHDYFPRVSTDSKWLTYGASTGCHPWFECDYEIFVYELGSTPDTHSVRLTASPANDNYPHLYVGEPWQAEREAKLAVGPDRLYLTGGTTAPVQPHRIALWSTGAKPLPAHEVKISYEGVGGWLTVGPSERSAYKEIVVGVNGAVVPSGTHRATIEVIAPGALGSPRTIPVELVFANSDPNFVPPPADAGTSDGGRPDGGGSDASGGGTTGAAGGGGTAGTAGGGGTGAGGAGSGGSAGNSVPTDAGRTDGGASTGDDGGCGCDLGASGRQGIPGPWLLLAGVFVIGITRRRRRAR